MELTNKDIDFLICMLDNIQYWFGLKPEELKIKEKLKRWKNESERAL